MPRSVTRTIKLYAMHGRDPGGIIDYTRLFERLSDPATPRTPIRVTGDLFFALDGATIRDGLFFARVVAGSPEELPTFFDYTTGQLELGETPAGKWLAKYSRIVVDPSNNRRMLALESSRSGVTATLLERFFSQIIEGLQLDLSPMPAESLREEILSLGRIREASVVATRPNFDWSDTGDELAELAENSGGDTAEAVVKARRGDSLRKSGGIVKIILDSIGKATPNLHDFRVIGRPEGSSKDVTISSARHQKRAFVDLDPSAPPSAADDAVFDAAKHMIEESAGLASTLRDQRPHED